MRARIFGWQGCVGTIGSFPHPSLRATFSRREKDNLLHRHPLAVVPRTAVDQLVVRVDAGLVRLLVEHQLAGFVGAGAVGVLWARQIGRASTWEWMCLYVLISQVVVSLQKIVIK